MQKARSLPGIGRLYRAAVGRWQKRFDRLNRKRQAATASRSRTEAAIELGRSYPPLRDQVLPTRFGNALRSFERHPRPRYGLDGVTIWPRINLLLGEQEREVVATAETDVAMFVNSTLLSFALGLFVIGDAVVDSALDFPWCLAYLLPFVIAWGCYRAAAGAVVRWGSAVRAAFDLHRLDLYRALGVKSPLSQAEETATAKAVNRMLLFGEPLPDTCRASDDAPSTPPQSGAVP